MITNKEFVSKLKDIALNYKTLYIMGCFGAPMNDANKKRYCSNHSYNRKPERKRMIQNASKDTFGFDCVCLIKGVLWGWSGNLSETYGGASYSANRVPDIDADTMITKCSEVSTDFSTIEVGEAVWCEGHIGVYIGDGLAVECTPAWSNDVQITACNCSKAGYNRRNWTKHGKLPYIKYEIVKDTNKSNEEIAKEVIDGKWGNGSERKSRLETAGYNPTTIQSIVNKLVSTPTVYTVVEGDTLWGIAEKFFRDGKRYTEIKTMNGLNSDYIYEGMKLKLPNK